MGKQKSAKNSRVIDKTDLKENMEEKPCKRRKLEKDKSLKRTSWCEDDKSTKLIYTEMGLGLISDSSDDTDSCDGLNENTPASATQRSTPVVPAAPRILKPSQRNNWSFTSTSSDDFFSPIKIHRKFRGKDDLDEYTGEDYINKLLDENILYIFQLLPRFTIAKCARVCRRWSRIVREKALWKKIDLSNKTLGAGTLGNVVHRGVKVLRLAKSEILAPMNLEPTKDRENLSMSSLQYLDLSMATVSTDILEQLFSICHNLRKISLENCQLNEKICSYMGQNRELECLNLSMCQGLNCDALEPIMTNCKRLESLNIGWTWLDRASIVYLSDSFPTSLCKLNWSGCRENITDDEVVALTRNCSKLKELDLSDSTVLSCQSIHIIAENMKELEHLALSRCYQIIPTTIPVLTRIKSLVALEVYGMLREVYLTHLQDTMPRIEINKFPFSSVARPTTGVRRTSIWGIRVRENIV
ncbi:S-phase kinase-associated protein 2 [Patella vulgata]|uniref:S-phase kinase-associated protein 2 n=1 Tax=Patella vulgata TaxID=6465 RepID=UPI0024A9C70B|nr:S-phase kinase-associated protein 2 [Patella vulgata]